MSIRDALSENCKPRGASEQPQSEARNPELMHIVAEARQAVSLFTELPIDAVASCTSTPSGWVAMVDVIEARARLGDNDLIATFEVRLSENGELQGLSRTRRYRRDDAPEAPA